MALTADVVICGGGLAGVSAAVAAARAGADTVLIEREAFLGGIPARGVCSSIFNCYFTADGTQAVTGIPAEIADALAEEVGYGRVWRHHAGPIVFDIEGARRVLSELVHAAGVRTLLSAEVTAPVIERDRVCSVDVRCAGARERVDAAVVVDCTGTAEVSAAAGADVRASDRAPGRAFSFRIGNVDFATLVGSFAENPAEYPAYMDVDWSTQEALDSWDETGAFVLPHGGQTFAQIICRAAQDINFENRFGLHGTPGTAQMHGLRSTGVLQVVTELMGADLSSATGVGQGIHQARSLAHAVTARLREEMPGFGRAFVLNTIERLSAPRARWLQGEFTFTSRMRSGGSRFADAVGRGVCYHQETKSPAPDAWAAQVMGSNTFDLPWRCLVPRNVDGLIVGSGRTISADSPTVLWVMPLTMMVGQAAGAGAAVAAREGIVPRRESDVRQVQDELQRQGVELNEG